MGRWVDEDYYGWTWVSGDPWGWAPYHYGNWYMSSFGWAWYPGSIYGRHYWRPAMVGFFGWGCGFGRSASDSDSATWAGFRWLRSNGSARGTGAASTTRPSSTT